jgi:molybdate transport system substrate-binding protein
MTMVPHAQADEVRTATAANFLPVLRDLAVAFKAETGHTVTAISASTGKLYAQIVNGAPFDVFLAADVERPERLKREGRIAPGSRFTYAYGKLTLWSREPGLLTHASPEKILSGGTFSRLAIANPQIAPYGRAALQVLQRLNVYEKLTGRIVQGEDISQTFHFVASGNAEWGFIAASQIRTAKEGSAWTVPEHLYDPIAQDAVLLKYGENNPAARALLEFLKSERAHAMIERFGYRTH